MSDRGLCVDGGSHDPAATGLWDVLRLLRRQRFVDLTHAFRPGIPHHADFEDEVRTTLYHHDEGVGTRGSGFLAHRYSLVGQWGTHVDPPAHFFRGKRHVDEIPVSEMLLPLVVFDVTRQAERDPDYCIDMGVVRDWEARNGRVPASAFAALRTGWSRRWPDPARIRNADESGVLHFPGWSLDVLRFLYEDRQITASGHETTDTDPGVLVSRGEAPAQAFLHERDRWQIELLANLAEVPESGAIAVATFPKPYRGSGFPARVFAIVPAG